VEGSRRYAEEFRQYPGAWAGLSFPGGGHVGADNSVMAADLVFWEHRYLGRWVNFLVTMGRMALSGLSVFQTERR